MRVLPSKTGSIWKRASLKIRCPCRVSGLVTAPETIFRALSAGEASAIVDAETYARLYAGLPESLRARMTSCWGAFEDDPDWRNGAFRHRIMDLGGIILAVQPDRASRAER